MRKTILRSLTALVVVLTLVLGSFTTVLASESALRLAAQTADEPGVQIFTVSNPNGEDKEITWGDVNGNITKQDVVPAGGSITLRYPDAQMQGVRIYVSYTLNGAAKTLYAIGANKYNITIKYMSGGVELQSQKHAVSGNYTHTAPATLTSGGKTYELASASSQTHMFGKSSTTMTFEYKEIVKQPYQISVTYVDTSDTRLGGATLDVAVDATVNHDNPKTLSVNDRNYQLMTGQPSSISHAYGTATRSYKIYYELVQEPAATAYNVNVQYVDGSGKLLGYKRVTVPVNETVNIDIPASIATANGSQYNRASGEPATITHAFDNTKRTYTVRYDLAVATAPYEIRVNYLSSANGATLATEMVTVNLNSTATFEAVSSFERDGTTYYLASGQNRNIAHAFSNSQRVYNFYYNVQGQEESSYAVTVQYVNIADNSILYRTEQVVSSGESVSFDLPATYTVDGTEYKLVSGQEQTIDHAFYLPRRVYSVFYQNAADNTENVVITDNTTGVTTIITPEGTTTVVTDGEGNIVEATEEDLVDILDNPVPAAAGTEPEDDGGDVVDIPDSEVPAAAAEQPASQAWIWWTVAGAAVLVAGGILWIVLKKKKAAEAK